ncbi:MAG: glutaredoxin family protein [Panacagrimonas sp.]
MTEPVPLRLMMLGRPDCGLCEEMAEALLACAEAPNLRVEFADVDSHPDWQRRYGLRVPVLLDPWGEVICEGHFDAQAVADLVREHPVGAFPAKP